jgi:hypothetical protein
VTRVRTRDELVVTKAINHVTWRVVGALLTLLSVLPYLFLKMLYSACIAVVSASCFALVTLRRIFIKHRRAKFAYSFSPSSSFLSSRPFSFRSYLRTVSLRGSFPTDRKADIGGGFWIRLLGSPTWEATIWSRADKASRKLSQQLSFTYQLHTDSRRRRSQSRHGSNRHFFENLIRPPACPSKALAKSERRLSLSWSSSHVTHPSCAHAAIHWHANMGWAELKIENVQYAFEKWPNIHVRESRLHRGMQACHRTVVQPTQQRQMGLGEHHASTFFSAVFCLLPGRQIHE